jgi:hypothetical protein
MRIESSGLGPLDNPREFREFAQAKELKREKIRLNGHGVARATSTISSRLQFTQLRAALRSNGDFGPAAESLDALERELVRFGGRRFPVPNQVIQNEGKTVSVFWSEVSVIAGGGLRIAYLIGGTEGARGDGLHPDLCRQLVFLEQLQSSSQ